MEKEIKQTNKYQWFVLGGFIFWFFETGIFGWNQTPINILESVCDVISIIIISWGIIGDVAQHITYKKEYTINTQKTVIQQPEALKNIKRFL